MCAVPLVQVEKLYKRLLKVGKASQLFISRLFSPYNRTQFLQLLRWGMKNILSSVHVYGLCLDWNQINGSSSTRSCMSSYVP